MLHLSCSTQTVTEKFNGVSFVSAGEKVSQVHIDPVVKVNANAAAVMPFGFTRALDDPNLIFDSERQWFGETVAGAKQYIESLQRNNIKVMLKPQLWVWRGEFTGDIEMKSEENWKIFETNYRKFILAHAKVAQDTKAAVFCIGTELEEFVKNRPEFWNTLIEEVKTIYKGKLTYAANWDEYKRVPFWEAVDFIGVDAYFPLSTEKSPTKEQLHLGWEKWKSQLVTLSTETNKPVLFTEFGYRSFDYTAKAPWLVDRNNTNVNLSAQADALQVLFNEFWQEDWFAGGFVWKWFIHHDKVGGEEDNRFTPQNKPAEETIRLHYAQY